MANIRIYVCAAPRGELLLLAEPTDALRKAFPNTTEMAMVNGLLPVGAANKPAAVAEMLIDYMALLQECAGGVSVPFDLHVKAADARKVMEGMGEVLPDMARRLKAGEAAFDKSGRFFSLDVGKA